MGKPAEFKVFQASAGSGKTYTIIKEYLKLCLQSETHVANYRHILAITFTNAAANEMKAKIVKSLTEIIDSTTLEPGTMEADLVAELGISDGELKHNAQCLMTCIMHDYSSFCVSTIDAFVQKLSRSFAHDLGLPNQYAVSIDDDEVAETIVANLGQQIGADDTFLTDILEDFSENQFDNERSSDLEGQLADFIGKLLTEKAYQKDENSNIQNETQYRHTLQYLNKGINSFEKKIKELVDAFLAFEKQHGFDDASFSNGKKGFVSFLRKLVKKNYEMPGASFYSSMEKKSFFSKAAEKQLGKGQVDTLNEALYNILDPLLSFFEAEFGKYLFYKSQRDLLYLYALRGQIKTELKRLADEEEVVHISEFNKLLNEVMDDFTVPFVYERIGEYFRHVFVDEFQDTSILQWQNLLPLVDNGLSAGEMSMVVGDGKQSIYRFRSGEVGQIVSLPDIYALPEDDRQAAFLQYQKTLRNSFVFQNLGTNYRSFANVVEFNNAFFEAAIQRLMPESRKVYVDQKPNAATGVSIEQKVHKKEAGLVQVELYDAESQPDYCISRVEAIIRELTQQRGYRYEDITVLVRRSKYGAVIANYLNDKGVPVISQVSILLKSSDKVQLLINTLRYLLDDSNESYVANLLYYWRLCQSQPFEGDVSGLFGEVKAIASGQTAIESVMGLGTPGMLHDELSKATCLYDLCAALLRIYRFDTIRDAFLNYFMEEVFKWQSGPMAGIADFLTYWDDKQDSLAVKSVNGNAVKIMTIHKSKGLEFPVVIYPEAITNLDERLNPRKVPEAWLSPEDLGFDPIPNLDKVLFKMDKKAEAMGEKALQQIEKERESNRLDNLNLLYVAFTRAEQRLSIIAKQGKADQANLIRDVLADKKENLDASSGEDVLVYRFGEPDFVNPKKESDAETGEAAMTDSASADWLQRIEVDPSPTLFWRSESDAMQPREWGELVHEMFSKIRHLDEADAVLLPYLNEGIIDLATAGALKDKFLQMTQHPMISEAFNPSAKVKTECEILYQGKVCRLDRYAELPEVVYLLDYKTGKKEDEHRKQVQTYAQALMEMTDKEIRACLVYLTEDSIVVESVSC